MANNPCLLPYPQKLAQRGGVFTLPENGTIIVDAADVQDFLPAAASLKRKVWKNLHLDWELNASTAIPESQQTVVISQRENIAHSQLYKFEILENQIRVSGTPVSAFYAIQTINQLIDQYGRELPCMEVEDWPDIENRGVMLDISRDKVVRMETVFELVERLSGLKINQLQLYMEHTFAYRNHPEAWTEASPFTGEEIMALDRYCQERFIELVPNQNSFGHLHHWLDLPRYQHMAEIIGEFDVPWGKVKGPFSVSPVEKDTLPFINSLYDELLPHFTSRQFNIGCDETFDLGKGKSKILCDEKGTGKVYLDFLLELYRSVTSRGFVAQFWGDIILRYPELVANLPKDMIALEWGYEADHPFSSNSKVFRESGLKFYVCPGTSTWNSISGRTDNAIENLRNASLAAAEHGAIGYLITDWGDNGHWQATCISWLGYAYGAAFAWSGASNTDEGLLKGFSRFMLEDPTGAAGTLFYELGNAYLRLGVESSPLDPIVTHLFDMSLEEIAASTKYRPAGFKALKAETDRIRRQLLPEERIGRVDADLVRDEVKLTLDLLEHACDRALFAHKDPGAPSIQQLASDMGDILTEYMRIWLLRNRPGGLKDSVRRFIEVLAEYQQG